MNAASGRHRTRTGRPGRRRKLWMKSALMVPHMRETAHPVNRIRAGARRSGLQAKHALEEGHQPLGAPGAAPQLARHLVGAVVDHVEGHEHDDDQADPGDPGEAQEQLRDVVRRHRHQHDGNAEPDDQNLRRALGGAGHGQHVVERHRHVREGDLRHGGAEAHRRQRCSGHAIAALGMTPVTLADLPVHLPAHPEQQDAAGERQSHDGEKLRGHRREQDAQPNGRGHAPKDHLLPDFGRHARGRQPHDHRIVARQHDVDDDHVEQGNQIESEQRDH